MHFISCMVILEGRLYAKSILEEELAFFMCVHGTITVLITWSAKQPNQAAKEMENCLTQSVSGYNTVWCGKILAMWRYIGRLDSAETRCDFLLRLSWISLAPEIQKRQHHNRHTRKVLPRGFCMISTLHCVRDAENKVWATKM